MKKYIFAAVLSIGILASPAFTQAAALTSTQISAIVALLQSFGADQTTINNVQASLTGGTTTGGGTRQWCHTFNSDLTIGNSGNEVFALDMALRASGIAVTDKEETFDENTAAAVVEFQAKYGIRQTGYVGPITRAKLNALYGCPPNFPPTPPPFPPLPPPQPSITALSPSSGPVGTTVTINGSGFSTGDTVYFQGQPVSAISHRNSPDPGEITSWSFVVPSVPVPPQQQCAPAVTGVTCEVRVANATSSGGNNAHFHVTSGGTTVTAPTVEFIGTPTLGLQYDSAGKEAALVGKVTVKVTAGSIPLSFSPDGSANSKSAYFNLYNSTTANSGGHMVGYDSPAPIPAGSTVTFTTTMMHPTKTLFAGSYSMVPSGLQYWANGNWQSIPASSIINSHSSNSVTIIGETSPYITNVGSDLAGNATMKGVRFGNAGSNVATAIRLNWQVINSGANTNNGYYIVNYVDGVGYINFKPADFGITTSGYYPVQIINSSTGNSNLVTLNYTAPTTTGTTPITLSSITPSSGPVGTSIRLDGCGSDSTSGFTLVYSGPRSGTASIPVETLGAASGCGYMTFTVPTDFPAGAYTLSVKNNQTGAMSTNSKSFTVTAPTSGGVTGSSVACTTSFSPNAIKIGDYTTWNFAAGTGDTTFQYSCNSGFTKKDGTAPLSYGSLPLSGAWSIKVPGHFDCTLTSWNPNVTGSGSTCRASISPTFFTITTASLPNASVSTSYNTTLATTNAGTAPYQWSWSPAVYGSGTMPNGLTLNQSTGVISGTPTTAGKYDVVIKVIDAAGNAPTKTLALYVDAQAGASTQCTTSFSPSSANIGDVITWNFQSGAGDTTFQYSCNHAFTKEDGTMPLSYGSLPSSGSWRIKVPGYGFDCTLSSYNPNVIGSGSTCRATLR